MNWSFKTVWARIISQLIQLSVLVLNIFKPHRTSRLWCVFYKVTSRHWLVRQLRWYPGNRALMLRPRQITDEKDRCVRSRCSCLAEVITQLFISTLPHFVCLRDLDAAMLALTLRVRTRTAKIIYSAINPWFDPTFLLASRLYSLAGVYVKCFQLNLILRYYIWFKMIYT